MVGGDIGAARIVGFMDFGEEVECGGAGIRDMEEGDVLDGNAMERASVLKEDEEDFIIRVRRVARKTAVDDSCLLASAR